MSCSRLYNDRVNSRVATSEGYLGSQFASGNSPYVGLRQGSRATLISQQRNWLNAQGSPPVLGIQPAGPVEGFSPTPNDGPYASINNMQAGSLSSVNSNSILGWPRMPAHDKVNVVSTPQGNVILHAENFQYEGGYNTPHGVVTLGDQGTNQYTSTGSSWAPQTRYTLS